MKRVLIEAKIAETPTDMPPTELAEQLAAWAAHYGAEVTQQRVYDDRDADKPREAS